MHNRTTTTPWEATGIVTLCFGWFILGSIYAVSAGFQSRAYSEGNLFGLVMLEVLLGIIALYILKSRGFHVGSLYPQPSATGFGMGILLYVAAFGAGWIVLASASADRYSEPIQRLMSGPPVGLPVLVLVGIVNGSYEEVFLLGFLLRGLRGYGLSVAIGVALLVRVLYHLYQGPVGASYIGAFGLILSMYFVATGKLFPTVIAHAAADIVPFLWT